MISNVLLRLDNAHPSADDRAAVDHYLTTADARRAALDEIRRVAGDVSERTVAAIKARYPQMARFHTSGYEKAKRDVGMLTNMAANAMFLGEHESLDDMFTHWFRTILKGVCMSPPADAGVVPVLAGPTPGPPGVREALAALDATQADRDAFILGAVATFELMTVLHSPQVSAVPLRFDENDGAAVLTPGR